MRTPTKTVERPNRKVWTSDSTEKATFEAVQRKFILPAELTSPRHGKNMPSVVTVATFKSAVYFNETKDTESDDQMDISLAPLMTHSVVMIPHTANSTM